MKNEYVLVIVAFSILSIGSAQSQVLDNSPIAANKEEIESILSESIDLTPDMIQVHPQPLRVGDAVVKVDAPERILSTSIYTITGQRMAHQVHNTYSQVQKTIPYELPQGEYLLKLVTENGVGLRRVLVR
jgi:hypothetical protein